MLQLRECLQCASVNMARNPETTVACSAGRLQRIYYTGNCELYIRISKQMAASDKW